MIRRFISILKRKAPEGTPRSEEDARRVFVLLHGLLMAFAAYAILTGLSGTLRTGSLVVIGLAAVFQALVYVLPEGYISDRYQQRRLIVLGVLITAGWLFPLSLDAEPAAWVVIVVVLVAPLIIQQVTVWIACTAVAIALLVVGRETGWLGSRAVVWETEFVVVQIFLVVWLIFAFLFDSLKLLARLKKELQHERTQARVLSALASSFLAARDVHDVFSGVGEAMDEILHGANCLMVRADPIDNQGTVLAVSGNQDPGRIHSDLGEGSPLREALARGETLYVNNGGPDASAATIAIIANSGLGFPLIICCEAPQRLLNAEALRLIEKVADSAARTIRNVEFLEATREKAQTDPLTGLPNRRSFQTNLRREFERAERHQRPLSLLMIDLDLLKSINDEYGHPVGDAVIQTAGRKIVSASRYSDFLASRYGGEEFAVILPETDLEGAVAAGQRICEAISETRLPNIRQFTASIGAACYPVNAGTREGLIEAADEALYGAKRSGRNQVIASDAHTLV
jgi:diguanylate cyclase (GGDEF)-like protein